MNGHPDVEALAAYAAAGHGGTEAGQIAEHLVGCAACAADVAAIRQVGADLAALPPLAMPADVAASIDAALAAERAGATAGDEPAGRPTATNVVPFEPARRRRGLAPLLTGAAAAVLVGAIGYTVVSRNAPGAMDGPAADAAGEARPGTIRFFSSGYAYDQSNVEAGALKLLSGDAALFAPEARHSARAAPTPAASRTGFVSGADEPANVDLQAGPAPGVPPADLVRCLDLLREDKSVQPVAVDYANFEGQPAIVVVLPFREPEYDVFVVTRRCGQTDDATLLHFQRVRRG